ncbi:MAG: DHH family phosphoesterase [Candidatus Thermoplasmatota archaeon]|nr:DHH family phosphoesterase [Candidatus Thermoplasmatota archaeon]
MKERLRTLAGYIENTDAVHIVTHIDADGLTAGAIAVKTLQRMNKLYSIEFVKQLDSFVVKRLGKSNHDLVWFTDLGSSIVNDPFIDFPFIVTDHHSCNLEKQNVSYHFNPHLFNLDGSWELSGSGSTYLLSKIIDEKNKDLAALALIGACGDLQDRKHRRLMSINREILKEGIAEGVLQRKIDIQFFGRETRPVYKMLQYANDPIIPGITGKESSARTFLSDLNIPLKDKDHWRHWVHYSTDERKKVISQLVTLLLSKGFGFEMTHRLVGEVYELVKEPIATELHDAKEFATLLNSTARYGEFEVGLQVCLGDRDSYLQKARSLLRGHRFNLVEGLQVAKEEGIIQLDHVQFFHAGTSIRDTIVGIIANMLLNDEETRNDLPLVGFAKNAQGEIKASARSTQFLVNKGLNLSVAIREAAESVDGVGGGHNIAAGATIPEGKEEAFLKKFEEKVKEQLSS